MKIFRWMLFGILVIAGINANYLKAAPEQAGKQALSALEIVTRANQAAYYAGQDGSAIARMLIVDAHGRKQVRQFTILRKNLSNSEHGEQFYLVVFSRPADVSGTVFLVEKKPQLDDNRWLYLPALDLVKRISASDKRTSFVGSHYLYEDVSGRGVKQDQHELISETNTHYLIKHIPLDTESTEFSYYTTAIDKQTFLPQRIEYFDANNQPLRKIQTVEVKTIQGIPTVVRAKAENLVDGSYTLLEFRNTQYNIGIPQNVFTERSLRTPPQEWLTR
ncbi:outer membrane lipoprotein-sorting protein [Aliikangiella sp. IMCC44632]